MTSMGKLLIGDAGQRLPDVADGAADCCVTSPPYWGLRDYGADGQIGLEATPDEYVERMVAVFREVRRVLSDDGVLWLNLGDCFATGAGKVGDAPGGGEQGARWRGPATQPNRMPIEGLKPKDLVGIPWRVAFALQADGWFLRSDIIWSKPNPLPESVTDRPTRSHEYLFLFSKSRHYFYNADACRTPFADGRNGAAGSMGQKYSHDRRYQGSLGKPPGVPGANLRSVWSIPTVPYTDAHFATFPPALAERCILLGCPDGGTVLDPFMGSGTTAMVAERVGRRWIGVEINGEYAALVEKRTQQSTIWSQ